VAGTTHRFGFAGAIKGWGGCDGQGFAEARILQAAHAIRLVNPCDGAADGVVFGVLLEGRGDCEARRNFVVMPVADEVADEGGDGAELRERDFGVRQLVDERAFEAADGWCSAK